MQNLVDHIVVVRESQPHCSSQTSAEADSSSGASQTPDLPSLPLCLPLSRSDCALQTELNVRFGDKGECSVGGKTVLLENGGSLAPQTSRNAVRINYPWRRPGIGSRVLNPGGK